jgi:predicted flap endonuclease-1-like 5' DNA nuclease
MDPAAKRTKMAILQNRVAVSASALAERHGLHAAAEQVTRAQVAPLSVRDVYQLEAIADLIDALVASGSVVDADATPASELSALASVGPKVAETLSGYGITNVVQLRDMSDADLESIDGIGKATIRRIRADIGYPDTIQDAPESPQSDETPESGSE